MNTERAVHACARQIDSHIVGAASLMHCMVAAKSSLAPHMTMQLLRMSLSSAAFAYIVGLRSAFAFAISRAAMEYIAAVCSLRQTASVPQCRVIGSDCRASLLISSMRLLSGPSSFGWSVGGSSRQLCRLRRRLVGLRCWQCLRQRWGFGATPLCPPSLARRQAVGLVFLQRPQTDGRMRDPDAHQGQGTHGVYFQGCPTLGDPRLRGVDDLAAIAQAPILGCARAVQDSDVRHLELVGCSTETGSDAGNVFLSASSSSSSRRLRMSLSPSS
jgi:hypothetical protein